VIVDISQVPLLPRKTGRMVMQLAERTRKVRSGDPARWTDRGVDDLKAAGRDVGSARLLDGGGGEGCMTQAASGTGASYDKLASRWRRLSSTHRQRPAGPAAMPAVAIKCLTLLKNPDFSLKEAASLIERDPI